MGLLHDVLKKSRHLVTMSKYRDRKQKIEQQQSKSLDNLYPDGQAPTAWDEIHEQREKGEYPWTHLSHDQDAEVWIDPTALPQDMSRVTIRGKDQSIPREWFHLPKGAEPPTVDDLLRDSSPETPTGSSNGIKRAKSPPICGRSRSKSRERPKIKFIQKKFDDDGGYEPGRVR